LMTALVFGGKHTLHVHHRTAERAYQQVCTLQPSTNAS
jgi:hypothetical protein